MTQTLEDTPIQWYDFGGEKYVMPCPGGGNIAALHCIRDGLFYTKPITGNFTETDLPGMLEKNKEEFVEELRKIQEKQ